MVGQLMTIADENIIKSNNIVIAVLSVIFIGFVVFLFFTERKLTKLEKEMNSKS